MAAEVDAPEAAPAVLPPRPDPQAVAAAAALIRTAKNPLIMVGAGAVDAGPEVAALARLLQAPVTAHRSGKGVLPEDDPLSLLPPAAWHYWQNCDLLIGVGSRLELQYLRWRWMPRNLKVLRIDIDPTEMVRLRPDVGLVTDSALGLRALLDELGHPPARPSREAELSALREGAVEALRGVQPQEGYLRVIRDVLPRDGFFVEEVSQVGFTARMCFPVYAPRQYVTCGYQDNLGFGFNTALGVKVAQPDKAVVSVSGDGGFLFGVQELATARQFGINVVSVVFNNASFGNVRRDQQTGYGNRLLGADLENPDFVALARAFGVRGILARDESELRRALTDALADDAPVVIEVPVPRGSDTSPWPFIHPAPIERSS